ncbi:DNA repair protein RecN [Bombilactobacillus bombi]|uniref:DNA repair protein RecN n=1 Tax=Bombilactobacillus bombi TaxID=1303590 RepID=A0A3R6ZX00_9LACO|nr:DNA repair protein RecN [Bombilactobacillus bombi]MCO6541655.1 DNA repair protein RecN [Lactobacillus sp.]RHW49634.1 DNA repair protein RecN [Bombilactobacillus bombi]
MLQELIIQDFAIIKKIDIQFFNGLTALTGETGAGKSIIMDALGLLMGNRGLSEYVRSGCQKALVQGLFTVEKNNQALVNQFCQKHGIDFSDQNLIIQRELQTNGRNICRINTQLVPVSILKQLGKYLVDISGQNQSQSLLDPSTHVHLLDEFGAEQIAQPLATYQSQYQIYHKLKKQLANLQNNQQQRAQQLDMLQFQVQEIQTAALQVNEEEKLIDEQKKLANFERIHSSLQKAYTYLAQNNTGIVEQVSDVLKAMQNISEYEDEYAQIAQEIESAYYDLQDSQERISQQLELQDYNPTRLDEIEQRLQLIHDLEKKYGNTVAEVIAFGEKAQQQLQQLQQEQQDPQQLQEKLHHQTQLLQKAAQRLSQNRHQTAKHLTQSIEKQLKSMYMEKTTFEVRLTPQDYTEQGNEAIEFYLQTNPGEQLKPLAKVASGGELARIMLALKTELAQYQPVGTLVFDEIDTGVSGRVAQAIGEKMAQIAQHVQVLCITHLPQVAAVSDQQYLVKKEISRQHTVAAIANLNPQERVDVIAHMLEGTKVTAITRQHAQELLRLAHDN